MVEVEYSADELPPRSAADLDRLSLAMDIPEESEEDEFDWLGLPIERDESGKIVPMRRSTNPPMVETEIAGLGVLDDESMLELLACDVSVDDTTPADALMGTVRYMPWLATSEAMVFSPVVGEADLMIPLTSGAVWTGSPHESVVVDSKFLFGG